MLYYVVSVDEIPERRFVDFLDVEEFALGRGGRDTVGLFITTFWGKHTQFQELPWFVWQRSTLIGKRSSNNLGGALREARRLPAAESAKAVVVTLN